MGFSRVSFNTKREQGNESPLSARLNLAMKQRRISDIGPVLGVLVLAVVVWTLQYELRASYYHNIIQPVINITRLSVVFAFLLTALSTLVLNSYDAFAAPFRPPISLVLFRQVFRSGITRTSTFARRVRSSLEPLAGTLLLLSSGEVGQWMKRATNLTRIVHDVFRWILTFTPQVLAFGTFLYGMILFFFGGTLPITHGWSWLRHRLPLPTFIVSPFFSSVLGMATLPFARGLYQRVEVTHHLAVGLLAMGALVSWGTDSAYIQKAMCNVSFVAVYCCRTQFYRTAWLSTERFTRSWIATVLLLTLGLLWLGMFVHTDNNHTHEVWWQFVMNNETPYLLRVTVAILVITICVAIAKLLSPSIPALAPPALTDLDEAHLMVRQSSNTTANLALLGDKHFLFSDNRTAFIMYRIEGRSWVACSDPVGPKGEIPKLVWRFRELCDQHHGWPVFYQVSPTYLPVYLDLGLSLLKLGEEALVPLATFSLDGKMRKPFRYVCNRLEKDHCTFDIIPSHAVQSVLPDLKLVSDTWLAAKNRREKGFSLGFFDPSYLQQYPTAVVRRKEKIIAFANLWSSADKEELSPDLMRYLPDASEDAMEYLLIKLMLWGRQEGYRWFNLGMAPLSGLDDHALAPVWNQLGALVFRYGEPFYNFQGLRRYKEKFDPIWEPRYLAVPPGLALPRILTNVTTLISSGVTRMVRK